MRRRFRELRRDVEAIQQRDPAARGTFETVLTYPGLHAVWGYRVAHGLWVRNHKFAARLTSAFVRGVTAVDIHPGATLGPGLFIDHATGVVIGETAEVGEDVTIYHGVTLGGTSLEDTKRHPTIGDRVTIGSGAKVLGAIHVGDGARIGSNAVVVKDVPENSVVVGVPGQVVMRSHPTPDAHGIDLDNAVVPDLVGATIQSMLSRLDELEGKAGIEHEPNEVRPSTDGVWHGEDFSI